jgi:hypothetical protein
VATQGSYEVRPGFAGDFGNVGVYTTSGDVINASLITGLYETWDMALDGRGNLLVLSLDGTVSEYTTAGTLENPSLISGLNQPSEIFVMTPEPCPLVIAFCGLGVMAFSRMVRRKTGAAPNDQFRARPFPGL